jgi:uncharacterized protein (DUF1330 family)
VKCWLDRLPPNGAPMRSDLAAQPSQVDQSAGGTIAMPAYVIFDVEIADMAQYQAFMTLVKPALEAAGAKYLARGGPHKVHEGDWEPRRIVLLEFPPVEAFEAFYTGATYRGLKSMRDACSSARLVSVEGLA